MVSLFLLFLSVDDAGLLRVVSVVCAMAVLTAPANNKKKIILFID